MKPKFFVGSYTAKPEAPGITEWEIDPQSGALACLSVLPRVDNPSYLALSRDGQRLYAALEGAPAGDVATFSLAEGNTSLLGGIQSTKGAHPCHLSLNEEKNKLYAANYSGGSLAVFDLLPDGSISPCVQFIQHEGSGPNPRRQEKAHVHQVLPLPEGLLVMDLGLDVGIIYEVLPDGTLGGELQRLSFPPGAGPRHAVMHPSGEAIYAIGEMSNEVYGFVRRQDKWQRVAGLSTLPQGYAQESTVAAIRLHADGKHLAVSNRGHDSIALFEVDGAGFLRLLDIAACGAAQPRDCNWIGDLLICACQSGSALTVLRLDRDAGKLISTGAAAKTPDPTCILPR